MLRYEGDRHFTGLGAEFLIGWINGGLKYGGRLKAHKRVRFCGLEIYWSVANSKKIVALLAVSVMVKVWSVRVILNNEQPKETEDG